MSENEKEEVKEELKEEAKQEAKLEKEQEEKTTENPVDDVPSDSDAKIETEQKQETDTDALETEQISKPVEEPVPSKKKWKFWKKICIGIGVVILLTILGIYIAGVAYFQDKFFLNTNVNGMDVSRLGVENVDNIIGKRLLKYSITINERGKKKEKITSEQIGYHYVSNGEVQTFKDDQNPYKWPMSFFEEYKYKFSSSTTYDEKRFLETINGLDCLKESNVVKPQNAYIEFGTTTYEIKKEVEGNKVNTKKLEEILRAAIDRNEKQISLEKSDCYVAPEIRENDEKLNQLLEKLNKYCKTRIEYRFGENKEVLDGSTIRQWISYDEAGNVSFDEEQVKVFIGQLADKYNTYDKLRNFKSNDGSMVEVSGGRYGWMIDQEQEAADLTNLIKVGAVQERDPAYAQTAVSWENSDLGSSYVEIDLTKQHLWMYVDGQVIVSSDFVSGNMSKEGCATPGGTYTLYYKKSPDVLRSDKPGDSYATPVTYWMPFNGGVGMHDANWRGTFGGNIYTYGGSHGCINLPTEAARKIYENIYDGFPIICFYR